MDSTPSSVAAPVQAEAAGEKKPTCKICCACPETRKVRDDCIVNNGEDACGELIEKHKACLRAEGFKV